MDFQIQQTGEGGAVIAGLIFIIGIGVSVFWMAVGWRAMRAHERLADSTERMADQGDGDQ